VGLKLVAQKLDRKMDPFKTILSQIGKLHCPVADPKKLFSFGDKLGHSATGQTLL